LHARPTESTKVTSSLAPCDIHATCQSDPAAILDAWGRLPEAVRTGLLRWKELPEVVRAVIEAALQTAWK
jgi:hypothetical protein